MCCNRGPRRTPIVVVLGKLAYEKYQEHKAEKQAIAQQGSSSSRAPSYGSIQHDDLSFQANNEIMEKAGISPPSYDEVITTQRAAVPSERGVLKVKTDGLEEFDGEDDGASAGDESFDEDFEAAQASFIKTWKARREGEQMPVEQQRRGDRRSGWEQKKAAWAARKAERSARGGCCC